MTSSSGNLATVNPPHNWRKSSERHWALNSLSCPGPMSGTHQINVDIGVYLQSPPCFFMCNITAEQVQGQMFRQLCFKLENCNYKFNVCSSLLNLNISSHSIQPSLHEQIYVSNFRTWWVKINLLYLMF